MHSFTRFSGLRFLYQEEMLVDGEEWWKRRGGPPAWNGADPDGWAGLPGPRPAQKLLLPADALAPAWGCGASFPGRLEQQAAAVPRWNKAGGLRPRRYPEVGAQVETQRFGTLGLECPPAWGTGGQ